MDDKLPPYVCVNCANQLIKSARFKARCIRAHSVLMEIVCDYGYITLDKILAVTKLHLPLTSDITHDQSDSEHTESDNSYTCNDFKQEDISDGDIHMESIGVVNKNILITNIRSTTDTEHSSNVRHSEINTVKVEKDYLNNKNNENDDITPEGTDSESTVDDAIKMEQIINKSKMNAVNDDSVIEEMNNKSNKSDLNENTNKENENRKSDYNDDNVGESFIDISCSLNESSPSANAKPKDKASPRKVTEETGLKDLNSSKINRKQHSDGTGGLLLSYKLLSCEICTFQTVSKVQLTHHLEEHSAEMYSCRKCNFITKSKKDLQLHIAIDCKEILHSCHVCNKRFTYRNHLKNHLRIHTGVKPFVCNICSKRFSQNNHLDVHMRIHTGEKRYSCEVCLKSFRQKGQLQNHSRIHSGEKPFSCNVCSKKFIQRGQLQQHFLIHTNEKPYSCDICRKSFRTRGILQNHLKIHAKKRSL